MFAMIGAILFISAAIFALVVITQMLTGYWDTMAAALKGQPLPRTRPHIAGRRRVHETGRSFTPRRLAPVRAAA